MGFGVSPLGEMGTGITSITRPDKEPIIRPDREPTNIQKQTIKDIKAGKINVGMPEQPRSDGPRNIRTSGGNIGDRVSSSYRDDKDFGLL